MSKQLPKVLYAIPSRGRWNRMLVLKYLPKCVLNGLYVFVIPEELDKYRAEMPEGVVCVPIPSWVDHVERKRLFMFMYAKKKGYDAIFMFDDDLSLAGWNPEIKKFRSVRDNPEVLTVFFRKTIPEMFQRAPGVGLGCKFMADGKVLKNGLEEVNGKMCCAFGYRVDEALEFIDWDRTSHLWNLDTMMNLFFLTQGLPLLVHYGVTWSTDFDVTAQDPTKGGCAIYRKQDVINEAFLRMITYFPGLVSRKKKMGAHPTSFLQIAWRKAYGHNLKRGEEPSEQAKYWAKKMGLTLPKPDASYKEDTRESGKASLRLELYIQGKDKDHLRLPLEEALKTVTDTKHPKYKEFSTVVRDLDKYTAEQPKGVLVSKPTTGSGTPRRSLF